MKLKRIDVDLGIGGEDEAFLLSTDENDNCKDIERLKKILGRVIQGELTQRQRDIIHMHYFDKLTYADIGKRLEISTARVGFVAKAAVERIKKVLRYFFDSAEFSEFPDIWSIRCQSKATKRIYRDSPPELQREKLEIKKDDSTIHKAIKALLNLGISLNVKGYNYLRDGILTCVMYEEHKPDFSKELYSQLAKNYNTSVSAVDQAIRHAIKSGWYRRNTEFAKELFGCTLQSSVGIPSAMVYILTVANWISSTQMEVNYE